MNQVTQFFGESHDRFMAKMKLAVDLREKRVLLARAIREVNRMIRLSQATVVLFKKLKVLLRAMEQSLDDGVDAKLAKHILRGRRT